MKKKFAMATLAAMVLRAGLALAVDPVCGDVNNSSSINTTDALLVLKDAVDQPVTLVCSAYDGQFSACQSDLSFCKNAPVCGDGILEALEGCEAGNLDGKTCVTQGFAGGALACTAGCTFDTSGCYVTRFDASGATIIDRETGLEWEKKTGTVGQESLCPGGPKCADLHDVNNRYQWSGSGTAPDGGAFTDFLVKLNAPVGPGAESWNGPTVTGCYEEHCDWRLPTIEELQSLTLDSPTFGAALDVTDPALGIPLPPYYWSSSTYQDNTTLAWIVYFNGGDTTLDNKALRRGVRAVRGGS